MSWTPVETPAQGGWRFFKVGVEGGRRRCVVADWPRGLVARRQVKGCLNEKSKDDLKSNIELSSESVV